MGEKEACRGHVEAKVGLAVGVGWSNSVGDWQAEPAMPNVDLGLELCRPGDGPKGLFGLTNGLWI